MTDEILAVIRRHEHDDAVAGFVITGYGTRAFGAAPTSGASSMLGDAGASAQYARDCSRLLVHLDAMVKPVVAALNGMALGGGFELAMRCHALVATRDAYDAAAGGHAGHRAGHRRDGRPLPALPPRRRCSTQCCGGPTS